MSAPPIPYQIDYIDPDGHDWNLSDQTLANGYICTGINGIEGLPVAMQTIPMLDGTSRSDLYISQPGAINIGILVSRPASDSEADYYGLLDRIVSAFFNRRNALPAPGYIIAQRPDGTARQISVFTISGMNIPEVGLNNATVYTFTLQTPDPFWYDLAGVNNISFSNPGLAPGILPILPIQLGSSFIFGDNFVNNYGGNDTYPEWLITGPGIPTIANRTTGRSFALNTAILTGHVVSIKTKPGYQQCVDTTTGANIWDQLSLASLRELWPLVPGVNDVNIGMTGSTSASRVMMSWQNRWLRA